MNNTPDYPRTDFLRDFGEWDASKIPNGAERADFLFSRRYCSDQKDFAYRFNRFACVIRSVGRKVDQLGRDKIVTFDKDGSRKVPQFLLLALHEWYCGVNDKTMQTMPDPDWSTVMKIYDRLKSEEIL